MPADVTPTALVIDDNSLSRQLGENALRLAGFDVVGMAENGIQGIALFKETAPDFVLLDIVMEDMSGIDALSSIREADASAYVVMLTAKEDLSSIRNSMYEGAQDFIRKDQSMERIVGRLAGHAERLAAGDRSTISEKVSTQVD